MSSGQYQLYVQTESAAGRKPMSVDAWRSERREYERQLRNNGYIYAGYTDHSKHDHGTYASVAGPTPVCLDNSMGQKLHPGGKVVVRFPSGRTRPVFVRELTVEEEDAIPPVQRIPTN